MPRQYWPQPWSQGWKNPYGKFPQYPQYPQFQQSYPTFSPQYYPRPVQQTQPHSVNPQLSLPFPQRPNQLPAQPLPNPNNNKIYNLFTIWKDKIFKPA